MQTILNTTQGDVLEFDILLKENCQPRPLYEGEQLFFETDEDDLGNSINLVQDNIHFHIDAVALTPGQYPFKAGIIYSTGERTTVFHSGESVLYVNSP